MSAPAGWYPQPDGTERFWDGSAWTEQIRAAAPPAGAVPPPPAGVGGESYTTPSTGYQQYPQPGQNPGYAQYPQAGQPAGPYAAPPQRSGMGRGCLIAAIIGTVVLVLGLGSCVVLANRAVNEVKNNLPSGLPSTLDERKLNLPELPNGEGKKVLAAMKGQATPAADPNAAKP